MPVGVPKVLYYWDDELPLQWIDLYNLIFRRRLVFVMAELDQDLCNQIAGMMVYIHFEDKRKELEKKGVNVVDLFEQTTGSDIGGQTSGKEKKSYQLSYKDLMDYDTIWDFEASVQKDLYTDLFNSNNPDDNALVNDYLENPFYQKENLNSFLDVQNYSSFSQNLSFQNKKGVINETTLEQYSNFFNMWLPMLPVLAKYSGGRYFSDFHFSEDIMKSFFQKNPLFLKNSNNAEKNFASVLQKYINSFQSSTNTNGVLNLMDRRTIKESLKRAHYGDFKDQKVRDLSSSFQNMDELNMLQNVRQKRPESEDLLFSETRERMSDQRRVFVFINSTGGSITSGITIYDALQFVKAGAVTVCLGMAFSASSMVLAGGNIGHRYVSEGSHVMMHQPEGGIKGQASDVLLDAHEILRVRRQAATIYTLSSKRAFHEVLKDLDRDYFMTPQEAIDYGLADEIVTRYNSECILDEFEQDWLADDAKQIEGISKKIRQTTGGDEEVRTGDKR